MYDCQEFKRMRVAGMKSLRALQHLRRLQVGNFGVLVWNYLVRGNLENSVPSFRFDKNDFVKRVTLTSPSHIAQYPGIGISAGTA